MADENSGGGVAKAALTTAGGMGIARAVSGLKKNVLQRVGGGFIQAGLGLAVNNHLSVGYKGPTGFRDHSFAFKFFPKNHDFRQNPENMDLLENPNFPENPDFRGNLENYDFPENRD